MSVPEAYIYDAVRTPRRRGKSSGSLYSVAPIDLALGVLTSLAGRKAGLEPAQIQYPGGVPGFVARAEELAAAYGERFTPPASLREKAASGGTYEEVQP